MNTEERNKRDFKGYTPIQLVVLKTLKQNKYFNLAKSFANQEDINLECKNPGGWTPLQESLLYVIIQLLREKHSSVNTTFQSWLYEASEQVLLRLGRVR